VYFVSKLARDNGVVVAQVGEGADELFWGYPSWKTLLGLQRYDDLPVPRALKRAGVQLATALGKGQRREVEYLRRGAEGLPVFWGGAESFTEAQKQTLLSPRLRRELDGLTSWDALAPIRRRFDDGAWEHSNLHWMSYLDLNLRLPELLLMRVDKMTMISSIEARVPFLDHRMVELGFALPASLKLKNGVTKYILQTAARPLLGDETIDRPKKGFDVPLPAWLRESKLGKWAESTVLDSGIMRRDLLDREHVRGMFREHQAGHADHGFRIWNLVNLCAWHDHWIEGRGA